MRPDRQCRLLTLRQAQATVRRTWPGRDASDTVWQAYHERAAVLYAEAATHDLDHHHEALFLAQCEREAAQTFADHLAAASDRT